MKSVAKSRKFVKVSRTIKVLAGARPCLQCRWLSGRVGVRQFACANFRNS
jgi:hypothetical protein